MGEDNIEDKKKENNIKKIVGIKFRDYGKVYSFNCGAFVLKTGDRVVVETEKGLGLGTVYTLLSSSCDKKFSKKLKKVFRIADREDLEHLNKNKELEKEAYAYCLDNIDKLDLKMNLFHVESTFNTNCLRFFFTADGRVDFRQLVKILVKKFHVRVEMRQVGVRNQAKMCGGIGRCGQILCCTSFLNRFEPVSIKMAKHQGLSLNPTKISGQCGRLMCCLTFENQAYKKEELKSSDLDIHDKVKPVMIHNYKSKK